MSLTALYDVAAPAKLNLFLHIIGRRDDGYHLLQSVFVLIDWCDTLHLERRTDGQLSRHDLTAALPTDDLCLRAARLLKLESGSPWGVDISIDKQVPWGAGMGGGSSDAASTLLALNKLWDLNWPLQRLLALGLKLGADVPFFLGGRNAWVEGIGEKLTPLNLLPQSFAVVKPKAGIETRSLFSSPLLERNHKPSILAGFLGSDGTQALIDGFGCNDLQLAAEQECPDVAKAARWLESRFGNSRMTGSGSAVFSRIGTTPEATAQAAAAWSEGLPSDWVGRTCRSLEAHPLLDWSAG